MDLNQGKTKNKQVEKYCECHYNELHMNVKIEFDIFLIILQFTSLRHRGKPKTILKLVCLSK
jgi:hypothetical protein